jgi:hypothetical protein
MHGSARVPFSALLPIKDAAGHFPLRVAAIKDHLFMDVSIAVEHVAHRSAAISPTRNRAECDSMIASRLRAACRPASTMAKRRFSLAWLSIFACFMAARQRLREIDAKPRGVDHDRQRQAHDQAIDKSIAQSCD